MKLLGAVLLFAAAPVLAQPTPAQLAVSRIAPVADPAALPLYPAMKPGPVPEIWDKMFGGQRAVRNVSVPTLTPVLPGPAKANGAAVIVIPGGGFKFISMDNEGWPVARWLADHGIAAFILKYRTNETPVDERAMMAAVAKMFVDAARADAKSQPAISEPRATADAITALRMVRANAARWHIDPLRVGAIGFSAGAMTALNAVMSGNPADRPDFFGYIYGPMGPVAVPAGAPPMFAALAIDDGLFGRQGFGIVEAWRAAKRPVELHAYERGDHGFGMGRPGTTTTMLMDEFYAWLAARGVLAKAGR